MTLRYDATGQVQMVPGTTPAEWSFDLACEESKLARAAFSRKRTKANADRFAASQEAFEIALAASKAERDSIVRASRIALVREYLAVRAERGKDQTTFAF
jgi:hypothetical protein